MRLLMYLLVIGMCIGLVGATLTACSDTNEIDISDIPCLGLTSVIACSGNVSVLNLNTSVQTNVSTYPIGGGIYNFTFYFNESSYSLVDCANNSATIIVGDFPRDDLWKVAVLLGVIGIAAILIMFALMIFDNSVWLVKALLITTGLLVVMLGINISLTFTLVESIRKLVGVSVIISIAFICIFVIYLLIYYMVYLFKAMKGSKQDKQEQG